MMATTRRFHIVNLAGAVCILYLLGGIEFSEGSKTNQTGSDNTTKVILNGFRNMGSPPKRHETMGEICDRFDVHSTRPIKHAGRFLWGMGRPRNSYNAINNMINYKANMAKDILNFWENELNVHAPPLQTPMSVIGEIIGSFGHHPAKSTAEITLDIVVKMINTNFPQGYPGKKIVDVIIQVVRQFLKDKREGKHSEGTMGIIEKIIDREFQGFKGQGNSKSIIEVKLNIVTWFIQDTLRGMNFEEAIMDVMNKLIAWKFPDFKGQGIFKIVVQVVEDFFHSIRGGQNIGGAVVQVVSNLAKREGKHFEKATMEIIEKIMDREFQGFKGQEIFKIVIQVVEDFFRAIREGKHVGGAIVQAVSNMGKREGKHFKRATVEIIEKIMNRELQRFKGQGIFKTIIELELKVVKWFLQDMRQGMNFKEAIMDVTNKLMVWKFPDFKGRGIVTHVVEDFFQAARGSKNIGGAVVQVVSNIIRKLTGFKVEGIVKFVQRIHQVLSSRQERFEAMRGKIVESLRKVAGSKFELKEVVEKIIKFFIEIVRGKKEGDVKGVIMGQLTFRTEMGIEVNVSEMISKGKIEAGVLNKITKDTADLFKMDWNAVEGMEFPKKNLLLMTFPNRWVSMVDGATQEISYMVREDMALRSGLCYTIYVSLKVVTSAVEAVLTKKTSCVALTPMKVSVNDTRTVETGNGQICGVYGLIPVDSVVITGNDDGLVVKAPWTIHNVNVSLDSVSGTGETVKNVSIHFDQVFVTAAIFFQAGPVLKFTNVHLAVESLGGMQLEFTGTITNSTIESFDDIMKAVAQKEIDNMLYSLETEVYDYIATFGQHRPTNRYTSSHQS